MTLRAFAEKEGEGDLSYRLTLGDVEETSHDGVFHVKHPELWWPVGEGDQVLHELTAYLSTDEDFADDYRSINIGFRNIKLIREKDEMGESFELK